MKNVAFVELKGSLTRLLNLCMWNRNCISLQKIIAISVFLYAWKLAVSHFSCVIIIELEACMCSHGSVLCMLQFFLCFGYDNIWWGLSNKLKGLTKTNEPHHKMYNIIVKTAVFSRCRLSCTLWKFILGKARKKGLLTYTITPESLLLCHNGKVKFSLHTGNSAV